MRAACGQMHACVDAMTGQYTMQGHPSPALLCSRHAVHVHLMTAGLYTLPRHLPPRSSPPSRSLHA